MKQEGNIIYASEGKVLKYKPNGPVFGTQVTLGEKTLSDGTKHADTIDDFEEIDEVRFDDIETIINISEEKNV